MINYGKQFIDDNDINTVINVLRSDYITRHEYTKHFELEFANKVNAKYAIAVNNATNGLILAIHAINTTKGHVITTPITFIATVNAILINGLIPDLVDTNEYGMLTGELVSKHLINNYILTNGIWYNKNDGLPLVGVLPVHYSGQHSNINSFSVWTIEDSAHRISPLIGDMAVYSFHPVKHITTGEGGMIVTNNPELYDRLIRLRNNGLDSNRNWYEPSGNFHMSEINTALGVSQLNKLNWFLSERYKLAKYYNTFLNNNIKLPEFNIDNQYHLYVIRTNKRDELKEYLENNGINTQIHYKPIQLLMNLDVNLPNSVKFYNECLSLPLYVGLTEYDIKNICNLINNFK